MKRDYFGNSFNIFDNIKVDIFEGAHIHIKYEIK